MKYEIIEAYSVLVTLVNEYGNKFENVHHWNLNNWLNSFVFSGLHLKKLDLILCGIPVGWYLIFYKSITDVSW